MTGTQTSQDKLFNKEKRIKGITFHHVKRMAQHNQQSKEPGRMCLGQHYFLLSFWEAASWHLSSSGRESTAFTAVPLASAAPSVSLHCLLPISCSPSAVAVLHQKADRKGQRRKAAATSDYPPSKRCSDLPMTSGQPSWSSPVVSCRERVGGGALSSGMLEHWLPGPNQRNV